MLTLIRTVRYSLVKHTLHSVQIQTVCSSKLELFWQYLAFQFGLSLFVGKPVFYVKVLKLRQVYIYNPENVSEQRTPELPSDYSDPLTTTSTLINHPIVTQEYDVQVSD